MERKRVAGRFVKERAAGEEDADGAEENKTPGRVRAPRPRFCRTFTRARVAEALPEIVEKFLDEARKGSIPHAKALTVLSGLDKGDVGPRPKGKPRGKGLAKMLVDDWDKERGTAG